MIAATSEKSHQQSRHEMFRRPSLIHGLRLDRYRIQELNAARSTIPATTTASRLRKVGPGSLNSVVTQAPPPRAQPSRSTRIVPRPTPKKLAKAMSCASIQCLWQVPSVGLLCSKFCC